MTAFTRDDFDTTTTRTAVPRSVFVLLLTLAMIATTAFAPARATTGADIDSVRAAVTETFNYKIGLLSDLKSQTDNPAKLAVLDEGIGRLVSLRDGEVATTESVDRLQQLDSEAHAIYHETVAAAENAGMTDAEVLAQAKQKALSTIEYKIGLLRDWIEGCDNEDAQRVVAEGIGALQALAAELADVTDPEAAYRIKDRAHEIYHATLDRAEAAKASDGEEGQKTEAEKAAEALAAARRSTLSLIAHKVSILTVAAESAKLAAVSEIFTLAADTIGGLEDDARSARSIKALEEINSAVAEEYETARREAAALRSGDEEGEDDDTDEAVEAILHRIEAVRTSTMVFVEQLAPSADVSPDTWSAVLDAEKAVYEAADAVAKAAETGRSLDDRWAVLEGALSDFRSALIRHFVAVRTGPGMLGGFHVAG